MSIYVQMVSYGNFDVVETIKDCINSASDKNSLYFGIVLQQDEPIPPELSGEKFKVQRISPSDYISQGEARRRTQQMYSDQDFVLQIDSGCRFVQGWDEELISSLNSLPGNPIITNFAGKLGLNGEKESNVPYKPQVYSFITEVPGVWPGPMKNVAQIVKGRYISDHFFFARGSHSLECIYDPEIYYSESEAFITLLSFTKGYDIYHHNKPIVWRNFGPRPCPWDYDKEWWVKQRTSKDKIVKIVKEKRGLGDARSLRDYELYSGIDFENRKVHKDTSSGSEPPNKYEDETKWNAGYMKDYSITVSWNPDEIEKCDDYDYWLFSVEDEAGGTLMRQDIRRDRESSIMEFKTNFKRVFFKIPADKRPKMVCVWPVSKSRGWLRKSKFAIN